MHAIPLDAVEQLEVLFSIAKLHQPRLLVCQAQTALMRVSRSVRQNHEPRLCVCHEPRMRVSRTTLMRVSPNASTESATELASLAYVCSLRSQFVW